MNESSIKLNTLEPWYQQYLAYDEDSLITYANAGLYRRASKDLDNDKVQLLTADSVQLCFDNDGQTVTLTADGLPKANCTCPTHAACKHIVASVLKLQQLLNHTTDISLQSQTDNPSVNNDSETNEAVISQTNDEQNRPQTDVLAEILALDMDKLAKKIGKAQTQKALNFAILSPLNLQDISIDALSAKINVASIDETIRYLTGTGFDGMLSNIDVDKLAWHWYGLSEIQRLHGKQSALREQAQSQHAEQIASEQQLSDMALVLVTAVKNTLSEFIEHGLVNLDNLSAKRLFMLSISARTEGLYRLTAHLRQLSGFINRWLTQDEALTERQLLVSMASTFAYLRQLKSAKNERFIALKGQLRRNYENEERELMLYPLGARWWRTLGGARGLTLYFWESVQQQPIEVTLARAANQDPNFDSNSAWQNSLWVMSPNQLMNHISKLSDPRFNAQGQLASFGSNAKAQNELDDEYITTLQTIAVDDWQCLNNENQLATDTTFNNNQIRLLRIESADKLLIDEVAQCVWWQVYDKNDNLLRLKLNWQTYQSDTVKKIKQLERIDMSKIRMILVYQTLNGNAVSLEPISLILDNRLSNNQSAKQTLPNIQLFNLDFDEVTRLGQQKSSLKDLITGRITQLLNQKKQRQQIYQPRTQVILSETLCEPILQVLESAVGVGRLILSDSQRQTLENQAVLATDAGMIVIANSVTRLLNSDKPAKLATKIFKVAYLCELSLKMQLSFPIYYADEN